MMSGPARYLGRIAVVGALPLEATTFYDGELFALTCRRSFLPRRFSCVLAQSLTHSVSHSLTPKIIIAGLRDVCLLASLHPSKFRLTAASSMLLAATSLLT